MKPKSRQLLKIRMVCFAKNLQLRYHYVKLSLCYYYVMLIFLHFDIGKSRTLNVGSLPFLQHHCNYRYLP